MSGSNNPYLASPWANPLVDPQAMGLAPPDPAQGHGPGAMPAAWQGANARGPSMGAQQWALRIHPQGGYQILGSNPGSAQWEVQGNHPDYDSAAKRLGMLQRLFGGERLW